MVFMTEAEKIKSLIDSHLPDVKTINDVSEKLQIPANTLRKNFLREERIPLGEYIIQRKVEAMKEMLILTDEPCYFVCYSVGMREDTGSKIFKKYTGSTMQDFRASMKILAPAFGDSTVN